LATLRRICPISGVAALNQYIYAVGGYDGRNQLKAVERYDTEKDIWEYVAPIMTARSALSVSVIDHKLYAFGKFLIVLLL